MRNGRRLRPRAPRNAIRAAAGVFATATVPSTADGTAKATLASEIIKIIGARGLTQTQAASVIGATQSDISNLKNAQLGRFALERLIGFLLRLERDIQLVVKPTPKSRKAGQFAIASVRE